MADIRALCAGDRDALYRICLQTGDSGKDATHLYRDPALIGHVYAGPYAVLVPETCFVLEDAQGVGGYILGAADTAAFEDRCEREWWSALRARYADPTEGETGPDARMRHLIHHPPRTPRRIAFGHPAHLHIDILPRLQGRGWGARLIGTLRDALAARGAGALHLGVGMANEAAVRFYRRYGFDEIVAFGPPHNVIYFGIATDRA